jgi:hypothetical protein
MIEFREGTREDASWFAERLREADRREIIASTGQHPLVTLMTSQALGNCYVAEHDGVPVAIFGMPIVTRLPRVGVPWLLGTDDLDKVRMAFGRESLEVVETWKEEVDEMVNYVDSRNRISVKWLQWLGFVVEEAVPHGPYGVPFHKFTWTRGADYV